MTRNSHIILITASAMAGVPDQASYKAFVTTSAARDIDQVCIYVVNLLQFYNNKFVAFSRQADFCL